MADFGRKIGAVKRAILPNNKKVTDDAPLKNIANVGKEDASKFGRRRLASDRAAEKPTVALKEDAALPEMPNVCSVAVFKDNAHPFSMITVECFDDEHQYLLYLERSRALPPLFLDKRDIQPKMRAILVDWMIQVQERFTLSHDALHLAWIMLDRFLASAPISKNKLQLLGSACLFIATKYEEVSIPHINDFVFLSASSFTKRDIMVMERAVFKVCHFNIGFAYPIHFLRRYRFLLKYSEEIHIIAKLFCDLFMNTYETCVTLPSLMAQVSLYLAFFIFGKKLPQKIYHLMGITEMELEKKCGPFIEHILEFSASAKETTLHRKYARLHINPRLTPDRIELLKSLKPN